MIAVYFILCFGSQNEKARLLTEMCAREAVLEPVSAAYLRVIPNICITF